MSQSPKAHYKRAASTDVESCASSTPLQRTVRPRLDAPPHTPQRAATPRVTHAVARAQGGRPHMEDRAVIVRDMGQLAPRLAGLQYCCVLDGHGGADCADFLAVELQRLLAADAAILPGVEAEAARAAFRRCFTTADDAYLERAGSQNRNDGSTALCVLLGEHSIDVANVGDTRAVLGRRPAVPPSHPRSMRMRECEAVRLSVDHKPNLPDEVRRVTANGGDVKRIQGTWRVLGPVRPGVGAPRGASGRTTRTMLSISRAFGDLELKNAFGAGAPLISVVPHVSRIELSARDEFLILASDGLWDYVSDAEAVRIVSDVTREGDTREAGLDGQLAQEAADALAQTAIKIGGTGSDNVTVLVIFWDWKARQISSECGAGGDVTL